MATKDSKPGPDIHWHEGMLLMPQHFQELGNSVARRLQDAAITRGPFSWGVLGLRLVLEGYKLTVAACDIVLEDGTRVVVSNDPAVPGNALIHADAFKDEFERLPKNAVLEVWMGVPDSRNDVSVVDEGAGRYLLRTKGLADENRAEPDAVTDVSVRFLRVRLFFGGQARYNHQAIKITEITRTDAHDPRPRLSEDYVPPLLDVTADSALGDRLAGIREELRRVNEAVGKDVAARPFSMLLQAGGNPEALFKLNATNTLLPSVTLAMCTRGVHPLHAYVALSTLVGALAVFSPERTCPKLDAYDHEDLRGCFGKLLPVASRLLQLTWSRSWEVAEFGALDDNDRVFVCRRPKQCVGSSRDQYLAVSADAPPRDIESFVAGRIRFMGQADFDGDIRRKAIPCVRLVPPPRSPDKLPPPEAALYFVVQRVTTHADRLRIFDESEQVYFVMEGEPLPNLRISLYAAKEDGQT